LPNEIPYSDHELFKKIAAGDEQAFATLVHRFTPQLFPYLQSLVPGEGWAEDLLQELFIKVWKNRATLPGIETPGGWLNKMAANLAIDFLRHRAVEVKTQYKINRNQQHATANPAGENYDWQFYETQLKDAVDQLTGQQKKIYELRHEEDLSYQEIAERMGISRHTVRNHLVAAGEKIRTHLKSKVPWLGVIFCLLNSFTNNS
jgi:RNA polymerase sigma-70 factor (family 1)